MAGIIQSQVPQLPTIKTYEAATGQAVQAGATGYSPSLSQVTPEQTVQGQVKQITDSGSPLMQQAERRANEASNRRGLINSSMAVGESQRAVYDAALPIAQQDATTHVQTSFKNQDAVNASGAFLASAKNQADLANAQLGTDMSKFNVSSMNDAMARGTEASNNAALAQLQSKTQMDQANLDASTRLQLGNLDSATRIQLSQMDMQNRSALMQIEKGYAQLLQANTNAANMYNQAVAAIANISQSNLAPGAKDAAIQSQISLLQQGLAVTAEIARQRDSTVATLNLSNYFTQDVASGIAEQQIQAQRAALQSAVQSAQSNIPVWGQNYESYQAPPGPNQSERTAANFNALYAQRFQEYQQRVAELNAFNAQYPG
jgi:hypothetical protein